MLPSLIIATVVLGSAVYFYFYQLWPHRHRGHKTPLRIPSDWHFKIAYRYIQISTPLYALMSVVNYQLPWPGYIAWMGLLVSMSSVVLFVWSMLSLRGRYSHCFDSFVPDALVRRGPYGVIRHPIYTANCLMLLGVFLSTASWGVLVSCIILAVYYYRAAVWEEIALTQNLPGYAEYRSRTGGFLPRVPRWADQKKLAASRCE
jgi:protein-S-isoprenylcysteine O-methyltransferase Ste14